MVYSIQQIRAIAAVLVVLTHVAGLIGTSQGRLAPLNLQEVNIAFTFAAGFLFQRLSINEPFNSFISRRVKNVIIPYMIISIPAILLYSAGGKTHPHVDLETLPDGVLPVYLLLTGLHLGPLWFIPMIFTIYLCTPAIKHVDKSLWAYIAALSVSMLLSTLVFTRPEHNANPMQGAAHYLPVFLIGMFCSRFNDVISSASQKITVWLPSAILLVALAIWTSDLTSEVQFPIKIVMLICLFIVTCRTAFFQRGTIDTLAKCSFGIFFIHGYFVAVLRILQSKGVIEIPQTTISLYLITAAICLACVGLIFAIRATFGWRSRLIVGA